MTSQLCTEWSADPRTRRARELTSIRLKNRSDSSFIRMCKFHGHCHLHSQLIIRLKAVELTVIPPADFCLNTTSGGLQFRRIPTASNSISSILFCSAVFVASTIWSAFVTSMKRSAYSSIQSSLLSWRPRRLVFLAHDLSSACHTVRNVPFAASCTIPGKSSNCIRAPSYSSTPGIAFSISSHQ